MGQLLKRQEEFIRYALFGIAAVAADVLVCALTVGHLGIRLANALSWLAALVAGVAFCFGYPAEKKESREGQSA